MAVLERMIKNFCPGVTQPCFCHTDQLHARSKFNLYGALLKKDVHGVYQLCTLVLGGLFNDVLAKLVLMSAKYDKGRRAVLGMETQLLSSLQNSVAWLFNLVAMVMMRIGWLEVKDSWLMMEKSLLLTIDQVRSKINLANIQSLFISQQSHLWKVLPLMRKADRMTLLWA